MDIFKVFNTFFRKWETFHFTAFTVNFLNIFPDVLLSPRL